ncbi:hypothetical protein CUMW_227050 [Citrus unshiu]|uniref:Uncharacterized protein n=1 Tax=Citrus unshiu TaxID=55188 RepID=A0A2H5QG58_CITUN|nr:hypothetical protein CUMW_227050 [Citrus unshiu]
MAIGLKIVWTLRIAPRHQSTSNRIVTPHQSMPHHRSVPRHRSVYVNSVVNSNFAVVVRRNFHRVLNRKFVPVVSWKTVTSRPKALQIKQSLRWQLKLLMMFRMSQFHLLLLGVAIKPGPGSDLD